MSEPLNAILAGCGNMSGAWLNAVQKENDVTINGLVDIDIRRALQRAEAFGMGKESAFDDLDEALQKLRPDIVFDCTVPSAHFDVTTRALSAGCHVLGEKPLADSMEKARKMVLESRKAGKIFAVMQNRRYLSTAPAMNDLVKSGVIGDITTVNVDFYIGRLFTGFRAEMAHPLLIDMAIHTFDQARQFTAADPLEVYCRAFNPEGSTSRGKASAMCIFEMSGGIVFSYRGSWCSWGYDTPWAGSWRVIGTRGTAMWDEGLPGAMVIDEASAGESGELREVTVDRSAAEITGHRACIRDFLCCIRENRVPPTSCEDNIKSLAMVFGAIESDEGNRPVDLRHLYAI